MTLDDLEMIYQRGKGPTLRARDGLRAVVAALRDEWFPPSEPAHTITADERWFLNRLNEILGEAEGKAAEAPDLPTRTVRLTGITKSERPAVQFEPAADPAPDVCEWVSTPKQQRSLSGCKTWRVQLGRICQGCGLPIRFVEAQR